ncbi:MAG: DUF6159 family protein [Acidobacteriota bacterium]
MLGRVSNSIDLVRASWSVLKADKELLVFPVISSVVLVVVLATFLVPTAVLSPTLLEGLDGETLSPVALIGAFLLYFVEYAIIIFFNTALVGAAMIRLDGGDPTVADGLRIATSRLGTILGYAALAATVGVILRAIRERSGTLGRIVAGLFGLAWSLATYLAVPVLVVRGGSPVDVVKESSAILKRTWGEQIAGNLGMGLAFTIVYLGVFVCGLVLVALANAVGSGILVVVAIALLVLALLLTGLVHSALSGIYSAALYRFAMGQSIGSGFDRSALESAFTTR